MKTATLTHETPDVIAPTPGHWPANISDLSPLDYRIQGKLQEGVYCSRMHDVAELKSRFVEVWEHFNEVIS